MSADLQQSANPSLSPRAGIAMLTLQVRATLQEAAEVEAQYVDVDHEAAKRQLRERLEPLIQERTRSFAEAIDAARDEAARTVAAAHEEASRRRAEAERIAAEAAAVEAERIASEEAERIAAEQARVDAEVAIDAIAIDATPDWAEHIDELVIEPELEPAIEDETEAQVDEVVAPDEVLAPPIVIATGEPSPSPFARQTLPPPPPQQINVSIDADAFAKVFATVFASIVEQRLQHAPPAPVYMPYAIPASAQAAPAKQGFWRHARHPDVLLLGLATAIVLVVLAAWLA